MWKQCSYDLIFYWVLCDTFYSYCGDAILSGRPKLSAKWRRSRKHLKWLYLKGDVDSSEVLHVEPKWAARSAYPEGYRFSQNYAKRKWKAPKPLIDIFQEKNWITIVADIAGFNKESLKINVKERKITLSAKAKDRRYYKSLNLPKVVIPNLMRTTYKNGVLEIKLKKAKKEETINKKAD